MAYVPNSNSVVAFQGTVPYSVIGITTGSVISVQQGSVAAVIVGGSIAASFTPPANQSVSGTVQADVRASVGVVIIGGSVATTTTNSSVFLLNSPNTIGSVAAYQGVAPWVVVGSVYQGVGWSGSVAAIATGTKTNNNAVPGANNIGALTGVATAVQPSYTEGNLVALSQDLVGGLRVINTELSDNTGTFTNATQTTSVTTGTVDGYGTALVSVNGVYGTATGVFEISDDDGTTWYAVQGARTADGVIETGYTSLTNISRVWIIPINGADKVRVRSTAVASGTVSVRITISSGVTSEAANVTIGTALPAGTNMIGSIAAYQGVVPWVIGSVYGNVSGSVVSFQGGTQVTSLVSTVPSSVIVGASIFGQLPAGTAMLGSIAAYQGAVPWAVAGSVAALQAGTWNTSVTAVISSIATAGAVMGSVAALQGTNPWIVNFQNSSILAVPVGSTITVFQAPSLVGTYAEDAASASGDKGFLVMGARNDTLSSVTSADGDYSSHVVGPAGELIAANAPFTKWVQGTASMLGGTPVNGGSVTVIAAQGASIFTYITGIQIANPSPNNVWLRFDGATSSFIGFTMAPANGGSNIVLPNAWKTNANGAFTASISGVGSVYITAEGFIAKI